MFNGIEYIKDIASSNKLVKREQFSIRECAGMSGIEPMMQEYQREQNFIIIDNTVDGGVNTSGAAFAMRRVFTCSIVMRHKFNDLAERNSKLDICREIYRQFLSRFLADKESYKYDDALVYLKPSLIQHREFSLYTMQGATGITFMLPVDEPTDLSYKDDEWE